MQQLQPDLLRISSSGFAACHVVLGPTSMLLDAGSPGRGPAIERELRALGMHPRRIILSHGDPDHAGGADHLRDAFGADVLAASAERGMLERTGWSQLSRRRRLLMRALYRGTSPPTVDGWLEGGETLDGLRILATPGHTPGHLAFTWGEWLLPGDAFVSGPLPRESLGIFTVDRERARQSIRELARLGIPNTSSSHGVPAADRGGLQRLVETWR